LGDSKKEGKNGRRMKAYDHARKKKRKKKVLGKKREFG